MTRLNFNTLTPYAVGFDRVFDRLLEMDQPHPNNQGFPPYNIRREDEMFYIDLALAGLSDQDVDIELKEGVLTIKSSWGENGFLDVDATGSGFANAAPGDSSDYLHRGISFKKFTRRFNLADDIEVHGAEFVNGLLTVTLERIIPEEKRPKKIAINSPKPKKGKKDFLSG